MSPHCHMQFKIDTNSEKPWMKSLPSSSSFENITSMFTCAGLDYVKCAGLTRCGSFHKASRQMSMTDWWLVPAQIVFIWNWWCPISSPQQILRRKPIAYLFLPLPVLLGQRLLQIKQASKISNAVSAVNWTGALVLNHTMHFKKFREWQTNMLYILERKRISAQAFLGY